jgi:non-ribosomal peptide synthetase component F
MACHPQLAHLSPADQQLFMSFGFGEEILPPFRCVHHAFEHHAKLTPDAIAVEHLESSMTYSELDRSSYRVASLLRHQGVRPGSRVCLLMQRSIPMVVAVLAVLRAGGQYIPLDGSIVTQSTLDFIIRDSAPAVIISLQQFANRISGRPVLILEDAMDVIANPAFNPAPLEDLSSPDSGCYIIYTSGTTGKPKGVDVLHRNVTNRESWLFLGRHPSLNEVSSCLP